MPNQARTVREGFMEKIDLRTALKHQYQPRAGEVVEVDVPRMNFLKIDGCGDPNTSKDYSSAVLRIAKLDVDYWGSAAAEAAAPGGPEGPFRGGQTRGRGEWRSAVVFRAERRTHARHPVGGSGRPHAGAQPLHGELGRRAPSGLSCSRWRRARTS